MAGVDRIGVADQRLDFGHRKPARPHRGRRRRGRAGCRLEPARPAPRSAARERASRHRAPASPSAPGRRSRQASSRFSSRLSQREGTVSASASRRARVRITCGAATACWKSCAESPMRRSGEVSPACARIRRFIQGSARGMAGPDALVQPGEHHQIGALDPRLDGAPEPDPGMRLGLGPHLAAGQQIGDQIVVFLPRSAPRPPPPRVRVPPSPAAPHRRRARPERQRPALRHGPGAQRFGKREGVARHARRAACGPPRPGRRAGGEPVGPGGLVRRHRPRSAGACPRPPDRAGPSRRSRSSSARVQSRCRPRPSAAWVSGCFSSTSAASTRNGAAISAATWRRNRPAAVCASGSPALSSAAMPQRSSSAATGAGQLAVGGDHRAPSRLDDRARARRGDGKRLEIAVSGASISVSPSVAGPDRRAGAPRRSIGRRPAPVAAPARSAGPAVPARLRRVQGADRPALKSSRRAAGQSGIADVPRPRSSTSLCQIASGRSES